MTAINLRPCPADLDDMAAKLSDTHANLIAARAEIIDTPMDAPGAIKALALNSNREAAQAVLGLLGTVNDILNERQPKE